MKTIDTNVFYKGKRFFMEIYNSGINFFHDGEFVGMFSFNKKDIDNYKNQYIKIKCIKCLNDLINNSQIITSEVKKMNPNKLKMLSFSGSRNETYNYICLIDRLSPKNTTVSSFIAGMNN